MLPRKADAMRAHRLAFLLLAAWVLIEVPAGSMDDDAPAIQKAIRVKTFDSQQNCENFRTNAMADDAEMGINDGLDQDRQMRCVSEDKLAPPPAPKKAD
jgi:hypothetical protein